MIDSNPELKLENQLLLGVDVVLLDVEGTTTPITFVTDVLFPYAREKMKAFLAENASELVDDLRLLSLEHVVDVQAGKNPPPFEQPVAYLHWLMDQDRKSRALKSIQGKIWETGYKTGELKGSVYDDVRPALKRWCSAGRRIFIYSSGSILAQKLLFGFSTAGDLLPLIAGHFDTTIGGKKELASYERIADELGTEPQRICFFSDVVEELNPAEKAGFQTVLVCRDSVPLNPVQQTIIRSFETL